MEFLSRSDDKKLRWMISESCARPRLIDEKQSDQEDGVKEEGEQQTSKPHKGSEENQTNADSVADKTSQPPLGEQEKPDQPVSNKPAARSGWRGRKGRGKGDRGSILLTSLEQEMLEWAMGGFLPVGPEGLKPSPEHQVQVHVVPMDKGGGGGGAEGVGSGDANDGEEPPRKRAKVMLLQVRRKGM